MSGGLAYVYRLSSESVNTEDLVTGSLQLLELDEEDVRTLRRLLERHRLETESVVAAALLQQKDESLAKSFVKVLPRDYAAVLQTRSTAVAEGLDPDGEVVWERILGATAHA